MSEETGQHIKAGNIGEVRYSLKEMLAEVEGERKQSTLGRELIDTNEIGKLFTERKRKKK